MSANIEFAAEGSTEIASFLESRIYEFNANATGYSDAQDYAAAIRDGNGAIVAAVSGYTWGGCCQVGLLWVHESMRNNGVGTALLHAVEAHARAKGCAQVMLSSHSFQAPDFYRRLGYVEQGRIAGYPRGHYDVILTKQLDAATSSSTS